MLESNSKEEKFMSEPYSKEIHCGGSGGKNDVKNMIAFEPEEVIYPIINTHRKEEFSSIVTKIKNNRTINNDLNMSTFVLYTVRKHVLYGREHLSNWKQLFQNGF